MEYGQVRFTLSPGGIDVGPAFDRLLRTPRQLIVVRADASPRPIGGHQMVKVVAAASVVLALAGAGCTTAEQTAARGAVVGAGTGAAIGALATGRASGALAGAAIGGATGAIVGAAPVAVAPAVVVMPSPVVAVAPSRVVVQRRVVYR